MLDYAFIVGLWSPYRPSRCFRIEGSSLTKLIDVAEHLASFSVSPLIEREARPPIKWKFRGREWQFWPNPTNPPMKLKRHEVLLGAVLVSYTPLSARQKSNPFACIAAVFMLHEQFKGWLSCPSRRSALG